MILNSLKQYAQEKAAGLIVTDVRIGMCYTAVLLDNGSAGVAYTFRKEVPPGCACFQTGDRLAGQPVSDILEYATSENLLERTLGIAAANALINYSRAELVAGDTLELVAPGEDDVVGMVGYFGPLVPVLKKRVKELRIFEKVTMPSQDVYPEQQAFDFLPSCSIALITSTSLINLTADSLLKASRKCRTIALVGSSTPLASDIFEPYGVNLLSGIVITDTQGILRIVSECGGTRNFKGHVNKVNLVCHS